MHVVTAELTSDDAEARKAATRSWTLWEERNYKLLSDYDGCEAEYAWSEAVEATARIETHYFVNDFFLDSDDALLRGMPALAHVPGIIVQGRYDITCPPMWAWELSQCWPGCTLVNAPDAGHAATEPSTARLLVHATESFVAAARGK